MLTTIKSGIKSTFAWMSVFFLCKNICVAFQKNDSVSAGLLLTVQKDTSEATHTSFYMSYNS